MVSNKSELEQLFITNLKDYPLTCKYFLEPAVKLINDPKKSLRDLLELQIIRYCVTEKGGLANLENYIGQRVFTNIEVPLSRLVNNFSEYKSVIFELNAAMLLKDEGMKDILFIADEDSPDIQYIENGVIHYAEVKSLREIDPEFPILDNKLESVSLLESDFEKNYYIQLNDASGYFDNLLEYEENIESAVNELIELLRKTIKEKEIDNVKFKIGHFEFTVSFNTKILGYHLMFSGEVMKYGSNKDIFLKMSSVYSRFINSSAGGIRQLAKRRGENVSAIKDDRLYLFLNTGRYHNFIPDKLREIINNIAKTLGMDDLVTLKVEL